MGVRRRHAHRGIGGENGNTGREVRRKLVTFPFFSISCKLKLEAEYIDACIYVHYEARELNVTTMVKVVSFDLVGTLVDSYYEDYVWKEAIPQLYARKKDISFEAAKSYVLREYSRIGRNDIRWFLPEYWFKHFNLDEDPIEVLRSHTDKVKSYPEVQSVLRNLSQEYDLIIASGTTRNIIEIMIQKFRYYFKHIYSPVSDRQEVKKTAQFYEMILENLEVAPCDLVHVGDELYPDFISPRSIGVKGVYLDRTGGQTGRLVIKDLKKLEDLLQSL